MKRLLRKTLPLLLLFLLATSCETVTVSKPETNAPGITCCKICRKGKACGDSCIARNKTCRVGSGCACNG